MPKRPPILVTGSHRSGTTWVGTMLSLSSDLGYINEPFNPIANHSIDTDRWFTYIHNDISADYSRHISHILKFRYPLLRASQDIYTIPEAIQTLRDAMRWSMNRLQGKVPLFKDPIALLSAEWLAEAYDFDVIVMIRHPAGFTGSLKEKGWAFPFEDLLVQSDLMEAYFSNHAEEIEMFARRRYDIIDQASLLWKLLYSVVRDYQHRHPGWTFLRHEDVASRPAEVFRSLYEHLGLDFSGHIKHRIESYSDPSGQTRQSERIRRDSQATIKNWEQRLTDEEVKRVRQRTEEVAATFYTDEDW